MKCPHCGGEFLPRASDALSRLVGWIPRGSIWTCAEAKEALSDLPAKRVYNALAYLVRTQQVRRIGYGQYTVGK